MPTGPRGASIAVMSDDRTAAPPPDQPAGAPAAAYPTAQPPATAEGKGHQGALIAVGLVLALALGALSAAIIARGDEGVTTTTVVPARTLEGGTTTTVQQTTTVTTPAPDITVAPDITLGSGGSVTGPQDGGAQSGSQTGTTPATTTSP